MQTLKRVALVVVLGLAGGVLVVGAIVLYKMESERDFNRPVSAAKKAAGW